MVKKFIVILSVVLGFMTSCQKEEPIEPPTYNQIDQPPTTDIPKFAGSTWVIYKFQTLNIITQPEIVFDTLRFVNNTELTYNNITCEYSFYPSGYLWYFELKQTPRFVGSINAFLSEGPINYGEILQQEFVNVYNRNQKWLVWMKKVN
jgi:hypothetical protein